MSKDGQLRWPQHHMDSICGDAAGQTKWDTPGRVGGFYKEGQVLTTDIVFAQNHLGRVYMRLCPLDAKAVKDCVPLQRYRPSSSFITIWSGRRRPVRNRQHSGPGCGYVLCTYEPHSATDS